MGAEQSTAQSSTQPRGQQLRKTETANFDFRHEEGTTQRSFLPEASGMSGTEGRQDTTRSKESRDSNYYWLEVGMDVVKKID